MAAQAQRAASGAALQQQRQQQQQLQQQQQQLQNIANAAMMRGRGRPQTVTKTSPAGTILRANQHGQLNRGGQNMPAGLSLPTNFQIGAAGQFIQVCTQCK